MNTGVSTLEQPAAVRRFDFVLVFGYNDKQAFIIVSYMGGDDLINQIGRCPLRRTRLISEPTAKPARWDGFAVFLMHLVTRSVYGFILLKQGEWL